MYNVSCANLQAEMDQIVKSNGRRDAGEIIGIQGPGMERTQYKFISVVATCTLHYSHHPHSFHFRISKPTHYFFPILSFILFCCVLSPYPNIHICVSVNT